MSATSLPASPPAGNPTYLVAEAEVVTGEVTDHPASSSMEVARRPRRSEVIRPLAADQLVESFQAYQDLLPKLLNDSDYQEAERGKKFVKKSGWRKIATAFDLDVSLVCEVTVNRAPDGTPLRARAWARAIAPSGRAMDGDGYCSAEEPRFSRDAGRQKLENDLCATATTRAKNRAISDLVGMGEVSAEEVDAHGHDGGGAPVDATPDQARIYEAALGYLVSHEQDALQAAKAAVLTDNRGRLPAVVANSIEAAARAAVHTRNNTRTQQQQ